MAKKFMFVCFGILALAAAYGFGARDVSAQSGAPLFTGITSGQGGGASLVAITSSGDIYAIGDNCLFIDNPPYVQWFSAYNGGAGAGRQWVYMGNVVDQPVGAQGNSLGGVKGLFR